MKRAFATLLTAILLFTCSGCGKATEEPVPPSGEELPEIAEPLPSSDQEAPLQQPVVEILPEPVDSLNTLIESMTLEEKVGQLFFVRCPAENAVDDVRTYHLGGYILFSRDTKDKTANEIIQTIRSYQDAAKIPLLIGVDEEGGTVVRVSSNPNIRSQKFSSPQRLYEVGGMERIIADTYEKDVLLKALGFNVNLAPVADISTNSGDFIYARSFGQGEQETADYVAAVTAQMAEDSIGSTLKHFPGYGNNVDTHTGIAIDTRPMETFETSDFLPFIAGMESGGDMVSVLVSHNIVECMDPDLPASLSPAVHEILRNQLGFDGVVMTDDLAMDAVNAYAEDGAVAVMSIEAGNDIVLTTDYRTQIPKVIEAVKNGTLSEDLIDAACYRVLRWKAALNLL